MSDEQQPKRGRGRPRLPDDQVSPKVLAQRDKRAAELKRKRELTEQRRIDAIAAGLDRASRAEAVDALTSAVEMAAAQGFDVAQAILEEARSSRLPPHLAIPLALRQYFLEAANGRAT